MKSGRLPFDRATHPGYGFEKPECRSKPLSAEAVCQAGQVADGMFSRGQPPDCFGTPAAPSRSRGATRRLLVGALVAWLVVLGGASAEAAGPAPPSAVVVTDRPDDAGTGLKVSWTLSPDDVADDEPRAVLKYEILRQALPSPAAKENTVKDAAANDAGGDAKQADEPAEFAKVGEQTSQKAEFIDAGVKPTESYLYQVVAIGPDDARSDPAASPVAVRPVVQWFNSKRGWFGIILLGVCGAVVYFIEVARAGRDLKIRKIAGLEAVDDAVGRATEMGRPIVFVPGIQDINEIPTVAGLTVLGRVARQTAEYGAQLVVPTARSLVMTAAREAVSAAYASVGRPDDYREDDVYYLTDEQFGYVAGVTGMMVRDKPAACFYMGAFFAESLYLAETGNSIGAIQLAGTAETSQLPFFVAACDYTLIGEEFFAASAYLSGEPHQLGSLKGQDMGKLFAAALLVLGCLLATNAAALTWATGKADSAPAAAVQWLKESLLGEKGFRS